MSSHDDKCPECGLILGLHEKGCSRPHSAVSGSLALREALEFYAERRNYRPAAGGNYDVPLGGWMEVADSFDGKGAGARARSALASAGVGGGEPAGETSE